MVKVEPHLKYGLIFILDSFSKYNFGLIRSVVSLNDVISEYRF